MGMTRYDRIEEEEGWCGIKSMAERVFGQDNEVWGRNAPSLSSIKEVGNSVLPILTIVPCLLILYIFISSSSPLGFFQRKY